MTGRGAFGPARFLDIAEITKHVPHIRSTLRGLGVADVDLDDVAQEVVLGAWTTSQAGHFCPRPGARLSEAVRAWLYGICVNLASHHRGRAHRRRELLMAEPRAGMSVEPVNHVDRIDAGAMVARLWELPPWAREVLMMAARGLNPSETARALGMNVNTVFGRLRRARRLLARRAR